MKQNQNQFAMKSASDHTPCANSKTTGMALNRHSHESNSSASSMGQEEEEDFVAMDSESKAVYWLSFVLLLILVGSTVACALLLHGYASDVEQTQFEDRFQDEAKAVFDAVTGSMLLSLGAFDSFVISMVSQAQSANMSWPFVTIPDFAVQAAKVRSFSKAIVLYNYILVQEQDRLSWEDYATANDHWLEDGVQVQLEDENFHGKGRPLNATYLKNPHIHTFVGQSFGPSPDGEGPFLPSWQTYPVAPLYAPYNWDGARFGPIVPLLPTLFGKKEVTVRLANFPKEEDFATVGNIERLNHWASGYIQDYQDPTEPMIDVFYPISTNASQAVTQNKHQEDDTPFSASTAENSNLNSSSSTADYDESVVGVLTSSLYWRDFLRGILQPGTGGVVAVFEMGGAVFTYAIDGPDPIYLGRGDRHDPKYEPLEMALSFADVGFDIPGGQRYTGLPFSADSQNFVIRVYPSAEMEQTFITDHPVVYTVAAVLAFAFTSLIFAVYSLCVERRQRKVMHTFIQTEASIALLEDMVRERTRELQASNARLEAAAAAQLQHFASMSHEIRTPMNGIIGLSSLLAETDMTPMQSETMKMIISSGELLVEVVNDVLDYSKLESGFVDIDLSDSNLQEALTSIVNCVAFREKKGRDVNIHTFYDPKIPEFCKTDSRRLKQILYNLLGNAVKFSKNGGAVELHVEVCDAQHRNADPPSSSIDDYAPQGDEEEGGGLVPSTEMVVALSSATRMLRFVVKDFGRGIRQEHMEEIYLPFSQAGRDTASHYGGTGLGLAVTRKLVKGLGGEISVKSQFGRGSEFTVELPLLGAIADTDKATALLRQARILLVGHPTASSNDECVRAVELFDRFQIKVEHVHDLKDIRGAPPTAGKEKVCLCLIHEDIYNKEEFEELCIGASAPVTFGKKHSVKECQAHFPSLTNILPAVLFSRLAECLKLDVPEDREGKIKAVEPQMQNQKQQSAEEHLADKDLQFLIAEDNLVNQKVLKRILLRLGFNNIDIVGDGQQAVVAATQKMYDIIWMDMQMPVMDGVEACRIISSRDDGADHPKPKIVFVTAHVQANYETECMQAGAVGFLPKPCNVQRVKEFLARNRILDEGQV